MAKSRTALSVRTKKLITEAGMPTWKTEHWNSFAKITQDLFGFIDMVSLGRSIVGVQVTSASNRASRRDKIIASPMALEWLLSQGAIWLITWEKRHPQRGAKALRWAATLETFSTVLTSESYQVQVQSVHQLPLNTPDLAYSLLRDLSAGYHATCHSGVPTGELEN